MIKRISTYVLGIFSIVGAFISCKTEKIKNNFPNIILIFADDLGYGDLSCYGHPNIQTQNIDKLADQGIRFTSFYAAAPVSTPSRAALLTGRYPIRNSPHNFGPESKTGLPLSEVILPKILKEQNYSSMAIGKWHLGHLPQYLPTSRGFDTFYGLPYSNDMILPWCPWLTEEDKLFLYENGQPTKEIGYNQDSLTVNYTAKALEFIEDNQEKPFFLYFAHSMPHLPVSTVKSFLGKSKAGLYGDVVETIDWSVGEIVHKINELGLDENTLLIFTSDNGPWQNLPERMLQKGVEPWHGGNTGPLRGSKATTYEGGFRVPAIISWPNTIEEGRVCNDVVTTMDLFASIVKITGGQLPGDRVIDGVDIWPLLKDKQELPKRPFFYLSGEKLQAVRMGDWKLRYTKADGIQLFNLKLDPSEKYNVAERHPEKVDELYIYLQKFSEETGATIEEL